MKNLALPGETLRPVKGVTSRGAVNPAGAEFVRKNDLPLEEVTEAPLNLAFVLVLSTCPASLPESLGGLGYIGCLYLLSARADGDPCWAPSII